MNIVLIDWDDTLFPTSWAIQNNIRLNNNKREIDDLYHHFEELDDALHKLFQKMKQNGKIVIVTNAMVRWVHVSGRVLKKSYPFILKNVNIISARDLYQKEHPNDIYKWKESAFDKEIRKFISTNANTHSLVSIGDADYEYKALVNMHFTDKIRNNVKYFKSIKFQPKADIDVITDQLNVLHKNIHDILNSDRHFDLKFSNK